MVYALVHNFTDADTASVWNPLTGSAVLFGIMCLLMECIPLCLYLWVGMTIPRQQETPQLAVKAEAALGAPPTITAPFP